MYSNFGWSFLKSTVHSMQYYGISLWFYAMKDSLGQMIRRKSYIIQSLLTELTIPTIHDQCSKKCWITSWLIYNSKWKLAGRIWWKFVNFFLYKMVIIFCDIVGANGWNFAKSAPKHFGMQQINFHFFPCNKIL